MTTMNPNCKHVGTVTRKGVKRSENQDGFLAMPVEVGGKQGHLLAVADGMGGRARGKEASQLVIEMIREIATEELSTGGIHDGQVLPLLEQLIIDSDRSVTDYANRHVESQGMGTTLTIAVVTEDRIYFGHVGDSRCWLYRHDELKQLTTDQTLAAIYRAAFSIDSEPEIKRKLNHVLYCAIGCQLKPKDIILGETSLLPGDEVLMTTDGIHDRNDAYSMAELIRESQPNRVCESLIEQALKNGSTDDMTAVYWRNEFESY